MQSFEYANPTTVQEAVGLLGTKWGQADVLAGGTDLLSLMKEHLHTPKRVVNIKNLKELEGIQKTDAGLRIGALVTMDELAKNADVRAGYKSLADAAAGIPSPQIPHGNRGRRSLPAAPLLVLPRRLRASSAGQWQAAGAGWRQPLSRHLRQFRSRVLC